MSESKHTRGPWSVIRENGGDEVISTYGDIVAWVYDDNAANAALIAAAPDMYDALMLALDAIDHAESGVDGWTGTRIRARVQLRAALNMAEGE